jgi:hypothetical protein
MLTGFFMVDRWLLFMKKTEWLRFHSIQRLLCADGTNVGFKRGGIIWDSANFGSFFNFIAWRGGAGMNE